MITRAPFSTSLVYTATIRDVSDRKAQFGRQTMVIGTPGCRGNEAVPP
jgi:hypothetical protein